MHIMKSICDSRKVTALRETSETALYRESRHGIQCVLQRIKVRVITKSFEILCEKVVGRKYISLEGVSKCNNAAHG